MDVLERLVPRELASVFNMPVAANADVLTTDLEPSFEAAILEIYIAFSTSTVALLRRSKAGSTVFEYLNEGIPLVALGHADTGVPHLFRTHISNGEALNIRFLSAGTVRKLQVMEYAAR